MSNTLGYTLHSKNECQALRANGKNIFSPTPNYQKLLILAKILALFIYRAYGGYVALYRFCATDLFAGW